ncbi:TetR/AcrR family transcriptional regulator [Aeromicrobium sp. UC242_57]|uniref:TetR/AcrR family transcriptional regulator n=1 Tax=Aeromicrobium sp. UC242_57 TaxID=3374624 RepID=UPI0037C104DD
MTEVTSGQRPVRRRAATRERLLDAARIVLARDGIQGASVEHICDEAGFTRGAFLLQLHDQGRSGARLVQPGARDDAGDAPCGGRSSLVRRQGRARGDQDHR